MDQLRRLLLLFALAFAVFVHGPSLLSGQFGLYPLIKVGDVLDLFTARLGSSTDHENTTPHTVTAEVSRSSAGQER